MSSLSAVQNFPPSPETQYDKGGLKDTNIDDFLKLMIAELQNQDPLDPMENSEMLEQLSQMRSIEATDKLNATLDSVLMGQNVSTASSLIGKQIDALDDEGANIEGIVDRVTVAGTEEGGVRVHIGAHSVALDNVRQILPSGTE